MESNKSFEVSSRFLASTLHEIRTPIQTIISTIELLQDTKLDQEQSEYVRQIDFSANVLLQLANDVLDYTKMHSNEFSLEEIPYDVIELTERTVDLISIEAFSKGLEIAADLDYSMPKTIMGDPTRVQQVILNLVKNAVKFTNKGYIQVKVTSRNDDLLFEVIDSGIGVPREKQEQIFNTFYQVDASITRKYGGSGLGLAICKNLITLMKGKIGVRSNPTGGSIFWFTIPIKTFPVEDTLLEAEEAPLKAPENTRILLVDDSDFSLKALESKMIFLGITNIESASSGAQALEKLSLAAKEGRPFTVAFIDMVMPIMDGWRLASEITNNQIINNLKMYMVIPEGQIGQDAKMKLLDWYNGYLYKPVKRKQLKETLLDAFENPLNLVPLESKSTKIEEKEDSDIANSRNILVAEDHPVNRKIIETFLKKYGANVYSAEDGEQAVKQIEAHPEIELIFMDILMPIKSGIDATVELRAKNYKGIIIACTANNDPEDFKAYQNLGINDIIVKPFKKDRIKQTLEKWGTVLSIPDGKEILTLTNVSNSATGIWDVQDFMDTVGGNTELAVNLMGDYLTQTQEILTDIKDALSLDEKDFDYLASLSHKLKGSSAAMSIHKLADSAKKMNDAAKNQDLITVESCRTDFAIDFLTLKKIVNKWKSTLN